MTLNTANATTATTAAATTDALFARPWGRFRLAPACWNSRASGGTLPARHSDLDVSPWLLAQNGLAIQDVEQTLVCFWPDATHLPLFYWQKRNTQTQWCILPGLSQSFTTSATFLFKTYCYFRQLKKSTLTICSLSVRPILSWHFVSKHVNAHTIWWRPAPRPCASGLM